MKLKTTVKKSFNRNKKETKNEFIFLQIDNVTIDDFNRYTVLCSYYYKDSGNKIFFDKLNFSLNKQKVSEYMVKFDSDKVNTIDILEQSLYYVAKEEMSADFGFPLNEINIIDNE